MTAIDKLKIRHRAAVEKLKKVAAPKFDKYGILVCTKVISKNLDISDTTVMNYVGGRVKDGFLTEALIAEFKSLNNEVCEVTGNAEPRKRKRYSPGLYIQEAAG